MKEKNIYKVPNLGFYEASNLGYKLSLANGIIQGNVAKYGLFIGER
jgi:hypothetical protein